MSNRKLSYSFILVFTLSVIFQQILAQNNSRQRLLVLTDIGSGDPDDIQSMIRLLTYSNEFDIEGLIAVKQDGKLGDDIIRNLINTYGKVLPNLQKHVNGFPESNQLLSVVRQGVSGRKLEKHVGTGKKTNGSDLIIQAVDKIDDRPLWINLWAGALTLAQALYDVRETRSPEELSAFIRKIKVYSISDQDEAGPWIRREFPELFYIVTPSRPQPDWWEYYKATWTGIAGDRFFKIGQEHHFEMVDSLWLNENIMTNHGALGDCYPYSRFIMEGDTPAFLGLINNGLESHISPAYGGWGGRYQLYHASTETHPIWTNNMHSRDKVTAENGCTEISDQATIWRWREHFQNDFAARMDWCIADSYEKANHNPIAVLNGDKTKEIVHISAKPGDSVILSAKETIDPDGDQMDISWWIYPEAGNIKNAILTKSNGSQTEIILQPGNYKGNLHVILQVKDFGIPNLFAYRRAIIDVK